MKTLLPLCWALLFVLPVGCSQTTVVGDWSGELSVQGTPLAVVFHIKEEANGQLTTTMDSPDQGALGIACDQTTFQDATLEIRLDRLQVRYEGQLQDGVITGTFHQGGGALPLTLRRSEASKTSAGPQRPQTPKGPFPYTIDEVQFPNKAAGLQLAGTLTTPEDCQGCPAVVLISGSGPQDRDESLLGHQPFWVIADHFSRRGIAVLRVDDRGVGASEGDFKTATSADFAQDAAAALAFLQQQPNIDPQKIGLLGHSEGGMVAPMVAAQSEDVAFVVSLAGPGIAGKDLLPEQARLISLASGATEEQAAINYTNSKNACTLIAELDDKDALRTALIALLEEQGLSGEVLEQSVAQYSSDWFQFFMRYDPAADWQRVDCPVLALNGALDLQVPAEANLAGIAQALKAGGNERATLRSIPQLNHLFQHAKTGAPSEYARIEETFDPATLDLMSTWILGLW